MEEDGINFEAAPRITMEFQETFKELSNPVRREILVMLKQGKKSAGEIGEKFDMTGATISYHLFILRKADLVRESKFKNFVYYELNTCFFEEIMLEKKIPRFTKTITLSRITNIRIIFLN